MNAQELIKKSALIEKTLKEQGLQERVTLTLLTALINLKKAYCS